MALTVAGCPDARLRKELTCATGKGPKASVVQELLSLSGFHVAIDNAVGPATLAAIAAFRKKKGLAGGPGVDQPLMDELAQPLLRALRPVAKKARFGDTAVAIARQHLAEHPREIGGANRGPWVRLYMNGNQGDDWPWCAGFVTYVFQCAAQAHQCNLPIPRTFSCDTIGVFAANNQLLRRDAAAAAARPGDIFLVPAAQFDWTHVGLVTGQAPNAFMTIEGNTNDAGSREGYEVCARIRAPAKVDLVRISPTP